MLIESAAARDLPEVHELLRRHGLPLDDVTEAALRLARDRGVEAVFLLTTTAEKFFPRFGFEPVSRAEVPESVRASVEFQSACPASAAVMRKRMLQPT